MRRRRRYRVEFPKVNYRRLVFVTLGIIGAYFFVSNAIVKYFVVKHTYWQLRQRLAQLKEENALLRRKLYLIKHDTATIEYYIRKELGYVKRGEKVYVLLKKDTTDGELHNSP